MRTFLFTIGLILLTLTTLAKNSFATIGEVTLHKGNAVVDRQDGDKGIEVQKDLDIFSYDTVKTGNGKVGIEFIDQTRVDVTEHSKLLIDEFVYDPNTKTGSLSLKATLGTVRYASGQIAKNSAQNVKITTPTATIAVRGTDFAMTVDELGSSTIILLPSCDSDGMCFVGEISVETDAGFVIMNQAFQATTVDVPDSKVDLVDDLNEQVVELEDQLNTTTGKMIAMTEELELFKRYEVVREHSNGLAETEVEKLASLVEDIDFEDEESFSAKVKIIKENHFKKATVETQVEEIEEGSAPVDTDVVSSMDQYLTALKKSIK